MRWVKDGLLDESEDDPLPPYESCLEGKMTKRSFTGKGYRAKEPLKVIHSYLCGSMNVKPREAPLAFNSGLHSLDVTFAASFNILGSSSMKLSLLPKICKISITLLSYSLSVVTLTLLKSNFKAPMGFFKIFILSWIIPIPRCIYP
ncbi:gag/pol protein [Cucumis melo var. makuwa]|uniref:Gag/pol protein n=1 Tax=Cucumis melo var. makuwa TaxID=1194695 RepID=A0A5D3E6M2_CUCMM|nr:gag/pol protein [Cucumis melo var. makuwa]TYK31634.1 gag/pol protein [Cucumis melo var. makuwa]